MEKLEHILDKCGIPHNEEELRKESHGILLSDVTYDDVLLRPRESLSSRFGWDTKSVLARDIFLELPIISSNMDTVTGPEMAILMAQLGGIGVLARGSKPFDLQVEELRQVKQAGDYQVAVTLGINGIGREETTHRGKNAQEGTEQNLGPYREQVSDSRSVLSLQERAKRFIGEGADVIVFDIANAQNPKMYDAIRAFKDAYPEFPIIAGNVATVEGTYNLIRAGADCIKVGIGPGGACTTRIVTGAGIPQLTAVYTCSLVANELRIPIIADGGIKTSGDIVKALAAGASSVMLGTYLAGTDEAPGEIINRDGKPYKNFRGMASAAVQKELGKNEDEIIAEGDNQDIPYQGSAKPLIKRLRGGLWSGMGYQTARNLEDLRANAIFRRVPPQGHVENMSRLEFFK